MINPIRSFEFMDSVLILKDLDIENHKEFPTISIPPTPDEFPPINAGN
jgi:hypothetical protein